MKTMGIVISGSSHGDFRVMHLNGRPRWVIHYHHQDILNYVDPTELESPDSPDMVIGLIGRKKREDDVKELEVIHIHTE